jgi:hypothetical protein
VQQLAKKRRAEGTLLGVAPPQRSAPTAPSGRRPVVVHAGVASWEKALAPAPSPPPSTRVEAIPIPPIRKPAPVPAVLSTTSSAPELASISDARPASDEAVVVVDPVPLKPPVAPAIIWSVPEVASRGIGEALAAHVRFAGAELPLWGFLAPLVALVLAGVTAIAVVGTWRLRAASSTEARPVAAARASVAPSPLPPAAPPAAEQIAALQARTPGSLSIDEVLALSGATSDKERQAAKLFREKFKRDSSAWKDKAALTELRRLVADPNTAQEALAAAAELPGPVSADLLYEIWTATPGGTKVRDLAGKLLHSRDVRAKASDALAVALELRLAETCTVNRELLPRARQNGDRRSVSLLNKLKSKHGCGPNKKQDCYSCLRDGHELDAAITASKARRAPNPFVPR